MEMLVRRGVAACGVIVALAIVAPAQVASQAGPVRQAGERLATTSEGVLRRSARPQVHPKYPEESLGLGHQGVAVVELEFAPSGDLARVDILEAPDEWVAAAMGEALRQWRLPMKTVDGLAPPRMIAKATYYFVISDEKGNVFEPERAPMARQWDSRSTVLDRRSTVKK